MGGQTEGKGLLKGARRDNSRGEMERVRLLREDLKVSSGDFREGRRWGGPREGRS